MDVGRHYLDDLGARFRTLKALGEAALSQMDDEGLRRPPGPGQNSPAVLVRHLRGNMHSRWTDFLHSDGERPDRQRDAEFELTGNEARETVLGWWEEGWAILFREMGALTPADLGSTVTIRGEPHTVLEALQRQLAHTAYHVGQIVLLARMDAGEAWRSLSIPRGGSEAFDREMRRRVGRDAR